MLRAQGYDFSSDGNLTGPQEQKEKENRHIPSNLVPKCPHCGRPMTMNLRADETFVEDEGWHQAAERYENFLRTRKNCKILFLELGVGYNTPGIIKYPFWKMTGTMPEATYVCLNHGEAYAPEEIRKAARIEGSEVVEMELKAQFRCSGAEGFVNWVTHTLQIEDTANYEGWDHEEYEFRIFDDPNDLYETICQKNMETNNNARMVAGFAWDWSEDKNAAIDDVTIPEKNFSMPWNARNQRALFAVKEDSVNQVGCIHTVQGLEFDYVGVIIGNDMKYDPNTHSILVEYDEYRDASGKKGLKKQQDRLTQYVKQIYKVLMSRGRYGCYVYCRDENLKKYLESRLSGV